MAQVWFGRYSTEIMIENARCRQGNHSIATYRLGVSARVKERVSMLGKNNNTQHHSDLATRRITSPSTTAPTSSTLSLTTSIPLSSCTNLPTPGSQILSFRTSLSAHQIIHIPLLEVWCLTLVLLDPALPQVKHEMMMLKTLTMPLMMALRMEAMPLTMAIRQAPMDWKTCLVCDWC
jgi:hypothetical protein